jgi:3'-phosphoadenosine 5'-phosphosulfate sulfotransferase (PAPS reductase)/FAD synthetase
MKIIVAYSGGKDSQASLLWAVEKYGADNIEALFCDTGWEHPVTCSVIIRKDFPAAVILDCVNKS